MSIQKIKNLRGVNRLLILCLVLFSSANLFAQNYHISPPELCNYFPTDAVFRAGMARVFHVRAHSGPNSPGTIDAYEIRLPKVNDLMKTYTEIPLKKNDEILIDACGCVQTGGSGKTWKRYVDPSGPNSGSLYHGLIWIANPSKYQLPVSKFHKNLVRIQDLMRAQDRGVKVKILTDSYLILGYEDDNYNDNGYWGHDDGTQDQCRGTGGALVRITIYHN